MTRERLPTDVGIRRKHDGVWLWTRSGVIQTSETPKFLSSRSKAILSVRSDMGLDLNEVELITRAEIQGAS